MNVHLFPVIGHREAGHRPQLLLSPKHLPPPHPSNANDSIHWMFFPHLRRNPACSSVPLLGYQLVLFLRGHCLVLLMTFFSLHPNLSAAHVSLNWPKKKLGVSLLMCPFIRHSLFFIVNSLSPPISLLQIACASLYCESTSCPCPSDHLPGLNSPGDGP